MGTLCALVLMSGHWQDAMFDGVLVINALIGIVQELRAKRALDIPLAGTRRSPLNEVAAGMLPIGRRADLAPKFRLSCTCQTGIAMRI